MSAASVVPIRTAPSVGSPEWWYQQGFQTVPLAPGQKRPRDAEWQTRAYGPDDHRPGDNIGVLTGTEVAPGRFLVDVDFDWIEGCVLAKRLLSDTGFVFGRDSKPVSHAFYTTSTPVVSRRFEDIDATVLVELRGTKADGSLGLQTMVPPSVHTSDEVLSFGRESAGEMTHDDSLPRRVVLYAIACLLLKHLGHRGLLHKVRLELAGALLEDGLTTVQEAVALGRAVAAATGNSEKDIEDVVRTTAARLRASETVIGADALAKALGEDGKKVVARIREWLGKSDALVLNPADPLAISRRFVTDRWTVDGVLTLRRQGGVYYAYDANTGAYRERDEASVRAELYTFLEAAKRPAKDKDKDKDTPAVPFQPDKTKVSNVLDALHAVTNLPSGLSAPRWLENPPTDLDPLDIVATGAGLLHIPTRTLHPATPNFFTLNGLDFRYDPVPQPQKWLQFLDTLWPDDTESRETLQEWFGYCLTPRTHLQKMGMLVGPPRSGKGTIGKVLRLLVGTHNVCGPTLSSLSEPFGMNLLIGKTVAIISDARIGRRTDAAVVTERMLSLSGEDSPSVQRKFLPDWNGTLTTRFLVMTNELPRIEDASGALASRFIVIPLKQSFLGREDHGLFNKLVPELPGILNWALEGYDRLMARGYLRQPTSATELVQALDDLNSPIKAFVRDCCHLGTDADVPPSQLFNAWRQWCADNGRERPGTIHVFAKDIRAAFSWLKVVKRGGRGAQERVWVGLRLTEEMEAALVPSRDVRGEEM